MGAILSISIGIGLITSIFFSEFFGIAAGGMIVPGYVALFLNKPFVIISTFVTAYLTCFTVHSLSTVMIVYGRRRTVLMILFGFLFGYAVRSLSIFGIDPLPIDISVVGYIIPGLIAIWIDRQGLVETFSTLITSSVIVRLILILITGGEVKL